MKLLLTLLLAIALPASAEETTPVTAALDTNTVARVNHEDVPYAWYLHEFRSTFFQYGPEDNARQKVFSNLVDRVALYQVARRSGAADDAAFKARLAENIADLRSYMEYQLRMSEMTDVIGAFLKQSGLGEEKIDVTPEDMQAYFDEHIAGQPGAPAMIEDIPEEYLGQLRDQVRSIKQETAVRALLAAEMTNTMIEVNQPLIDAVPLPRMPEDTPPGFEFEPAAIE